MSATLRAAWDGWAGMSVPRGNRLNSSASFPKMPDEHDRLIEILNRALAQPSAEAREHYLAEACGQDRELRQQVDALLAAHHDAGDFLRNSVPAVAESAAVGEGVGSVIGRYKLLEQIGEGGFGLVFMAEQSEPVRRMVALKIIKAGMDTRACY